MCVFRNIILLALCCVYVSGEQNEESRNTTAPNKNRIPPDRNPSHHIYLSYTHDPFAGSTRLKQKIRILNSSEAVFAKDQRIQMVPETNQIKFDSFENNTSGKQSPEYSGNSREPRLKRGVLQLYNMITCATGCDPLSYKGYGCFCGFLGSGHPVDGIDRCCKIHDWCYDAANCHLFTEYIVPYYWTCYNRRPLCAVPREDWSGMGTCAQRLCECDRTLSECLRKFPCPSSRALCKYSPFRLLQNTLFFF